MIKDFSIATRLHGYDLTCGLPENVNLSYSFLVGAIKFDSDPGVSSYD